MPELGGVELRRTPGNRGCFRRRRRRTRWREPGERDGRSILALDKIRCRRSQTAARKPKAKSDRRREPRCSGCGIACGHGCDARGRRQAANRYRRQHRSAHRHRDARSHGGWPRRGRRRLCGCGHVDPRPVGVQGRCGRRGPGHGRRRRLHGDRRRIAEDRRPARA